MPIKFMQKRDSGDGAGTGAQIWLLPFADLPKKRYLKNTGIDEGFPCRNISHFHGRKAITYWLVTLM